MSSSNCTRQSGGVESVPETKSVPRRANVRDHGTGTEVQVHDDPTSADKANSIRITPAQFDELIEYWMGVENSKDDSIDLSVDSYGRLCMVLLSGQTVIDNDFRCDEAGDPA